MSEGVRRFSVADCEGLRPSLRLMRLRPLILPSPGGWLPHVFKVVDPRTNVKKKMRKCCGQGSKRRNSLWLPIKMLV
jgi:hypothetical protein